MTAVVINAFNDGISPPHSLSIGTANVCITLRISWIGWIGFVSLLREPYCGRYAKQARYPDLSARQALADIRCNPLDCAMLVLRN